MWSRLRSIRPSVTTVARRFMSTVSLPSSTPFVSVEWLAAQNLSNPRLKFVDASWFMPADKIDPHKQYIERRLPHARFFDVETIADTSFGLPHMMPTIEHFEHSVGTGLGLHPIDDTIIVYDSRGVFSSPRVWYTLKLYGGQNIAILDGGLPAYLNHRLPTESGPVQPFTPTQWRVPPQALIRRRDVTIRTAAGVMSNLVLSTTKSALVIDARSAERFAGSVPEPRPTLRRGHIPFSVSVPFTDVLTKRPPAPATGGVETTHMKSPEELRRVYEARGVVFPTSSSAGDGKSRALINSCGSGMTACINIAALHTAGYPLDSLHLYDGSWTEWGGNPMFPVETFVSNIPEGAAPLPNINFTGAAAAAAKK